MEERSTMPAIAILTFGRFTLCRAEQEIAPPGRQGDTLCKALLCQPGRQAESAWLLEHLWPEAEGDLAVTYLHNAAWSLRQSLPAGMLLTHKATQSYQLAGQDQLWVDADAALARIAEADTLGRATAEALPRLEQAVQYFRRGRFLAGVEETWVQARRIHIETMRERAFTWLVEGYRTHGKLAQAEALLAEALAEDPTNENLLCALMQILHEAGMTHQALRAYEEFAKSLKKAGLEPAEMTTALYRHLKRAPRGLALSALSTTAPSSLPSSSLADPQQENASQARDTTEPLLRSGALQDAQTILLPFFTQAVKQGILGAISELEGPLSLNAADRTLRRAIVAALGGVPFTDWMLSSNLLSDASQPRTLLQEDLLTFFERTVTNLWNLYYSDGAGQVIHEIAPLMRAITGLLAFAQGSAQHKRILTLLTLGYQLQCCVLRDQMDYAQAHIAYQRAFDAAKELEDVALMASALAREGVTFIQQEQPEQALLYLNTALPIIDGHPLPLLKGYILQALSEAHAKLHQDQACWQNLAAAEKSVLVDQERLPEKNVGLIRCNTVSIMAQKGVDAVLLQDYAQAVHLISSSLVTYDPRLVRGRARLVAQQAEAYYGLGVLDACIQSALEALTLAQSVGSNKTRSRIEKLHADLCQSRWRKEESVAHLGAMLHESQS
jgi:DNA-binding SARP family transcriptional activator